MSNKTPKLQNKLRQSKVFKELNNKIQNKIILMDGAMGTMIQQENLSEGDYRGNDNSHKSKLTENQIKILKTAYKNGTTLKHEVIKAGLIKENEYDKIMNPLKMTKPK